MGTKLEEFVDVQVDAITKRMNQDKYENIQDGIDHFYAIMEDFVHKNYHRADFKFVEYDPDYDQPEQTGHDILASIKGHGLIDFMVADLFGVSIYVMIITQE